MDQQTRYRVTGTLFLLALAGICVPMLFDPSGPAAVEIDPLEVSMDQPDVEPIDGDAPNADFVERIDALRAEVDDAGFSRGDRTRFGEPVLREVTKATRVWAVQVASFIEYDNAVKLRDELREQGHEAFISTVREGANVLNRVAVGPLLSLEEAARLRDSVAEDLSLDPRLVAFSN